MVHDRRVGEKELILGVSGKLIDGNLMMYDTESDSLWHQASGASTEGAFVGQRLAELPEGSWAVYRWKDWLRDHPETLVLSCAHCEGRGEATGTIDELRTGNGAQDEASNAD